MLISGKQILQHAYENGYAVPAFNFANMENLQAIIEGAEEMNAPVIIQTTQGAIDYAGFEYLADIGIGAAQRSRVPVVLHLDHGQKYEYCLKAIQLGWTSIMIDSSLEKLAENVRKVNEVIKIARPLGIAVEAELGIIGGKEDDLKSEQDIYTEVKDAVDFYQATHCDALAIAVGTAHGIYKGTVKIDFNRIQEIREKLPIPLVLHGSSGVPLEMVSQAVRCGINKVNFDTELKLANLQALQTFMTKNPGVYDIRKMYRPCRQAMKEVVKAKIEACKATNKSWVVL
ncbi:ketose-bisphosphate aldolase class-ii [Lucifera butyrica]|uniref:Ketose-bisphosphate aldolase class-ii n=1 Tax=Lucifera butyrica TaxID=1351585 RepID=A0A498R7L9_9FIRM|nr:ketose-bisphosphate aldolase class-ii [Lucifera butyrica]